MVDAAMRAVDETVSAWLAAVLALGIVVIAGGDPSLVVAAAAATVAVLATVASLVGLTTFRHSTDPQPIAAYSRLRPATAYDGYRPGAVPASDPRTPRAP